jgi:hypothetical protein
MAIAVKGKVPVLLKIVFELRFRQGFTYLDRCGRTINLIQEYFPDWISPAAQPTAQVASLVNTESGAKFNFNSLKLDTSLDRSQDGTLEESQITDFAKDTNAITEIVIDTLQLAEFSRMGCRIWYQFPSNTMQEAREFLESLKLCTASSILTAAFEGQFESVATAATIDGKVTKMSRPIAGRGSCEAGRRSGSEESTGRKGPTGICTSGRCQGHGVFGTSQGSDRKSGPPAGGRRPPKVRIELLNFGPQEPSARGSGRKPPPYFSQG